MVQFYLFCFFTTKQWLSLITTYQAFPEDEDPLKIHEFRFKQKHHSQQSNSENAVIVVVDRLMLDRLLFCGTSSSSSPSLLELYFCFVSISL